MKKEVFITGLASFFPNSPVSNDEIEDFLGLISGKHSKVQRVVLKQNGIKKRYYALNKNQKITHTNAEMAMQAIQKLLASTGKSQKEIELLACATATPDQILPSHASMVHGLWEEPVEIFSSAGVCLSCLQALKIAYLSIASSEKQNAICSTSELVSAMLLSKNFDIEYERCCNLGVNPYMALEKDFLRFMLSDGASCALLENHPKNEGVSLKIEWIEMDSYANETPTCMFAGAVREENGELKSWKAFETQDLVDNSLMVIKQDIKLLGVKLIPLWIRHIKSCLNKHHLTTEDIRDIASSIDEDDKLELDLNEERVSSIIDYFISIGITNIKDIIITKPNLFYDDVNSIKERIEKYSNTNILELLKEDPINFDLIGM